MIKKQILEDMKQITLFIAVLLVSSSLLQAQNSTMESYVSGPNEPIRSLIKYTDTDSTVVDKEIVNNTDETEGNEEEELEVVEMGVITPMTRLALPSDEDEPMVRMYDNNGKEYFIRRNPNPNWEEPEKTSWRKERKIRRLKMKGKLPSV